MTPIESRIVHWNLATNICAFDLGHECSFLHDVDFIDFYYQLFVTNVLSERIEAK